MLECPDRQRLAEELLKYSQKLQMLLELEGRLVTRHDVGRLRDCESALREQFELYNSAVVGYRQHLEEHGCGAEGAAV